MSDLFVVALGLGTVFVGLVCIIFICKVMSMALSGIGSGENTPAAAAPAVSAPSGGAGIANRQEFIAAVSAAIAEDMQSDVSKIRILSVKKL